MKFNVRENAAIIIPVNIRSRFCIRAFRVVVDVTWAVVPKCENICEQRSISISATLTGEVAEKSFGVKSN